jgi:hypothetical protein
MSWEDNLGVLVCRHALRGDAIVFVVHDRSGGWQFLCDRDHSDLDASAFAIVGVGHLVERQPELAEFQTLDIGWSADRNRRGTWVRAPLPLAERK